MAYREDLAYIHDAGFLGLADSAASLLVEELRRGGIRGGTVVDLCCGSGPLSRRLSDAGYDPFGADVSRAMLDLARERVPEGCFVQGPILAPEFPSCVAVAAVGECFNYLFDEGNTREGLEGLLRRIHAALLPGGVLLFDVAGPGRVPGPGPSRTHAEGDDWAVLATAEEDEEHRVLTRRITTFREEAGGLYRRDGEVHRLRLIRREAMAAELRDLGFVVRVLDGYGTFRFPPGLAGVLARKQ